MPPSLNIISKSIIANNRFANLNTEQLIQKQQDYHSNKFIRYFKAHKGRTLILFILMIILLICFYYQIPINGDLDTTNSLTQTASAISYIIANIFTTLLIAIIGVETYMSREELNELKEMADTQMINLLETKKNNYLNIEKLKNFIEKYYNELKINNKILNKYKIPKNIEKNTNSIYVKPNKISASNDNEEIIIKNDDLVKLLEEQLLIIDDPKLKFKMLKKLNKILI